MHTLDWIVVAFYGLALLGVGYYYSRRVESREDYLLGGRSMKPTAVGLSMFATLFSTITYLAFPGEMIRHGPMLLAAILAYPLVYWIVGWAIIPHFVCLRVTSGYELLERRLGVGVRMLGVFMFLALRLLWMAVIIYATADAVLVPLLGLTAKYTPLICFVMIVLTIVYTSMGGMRAVVATDVIQTVILFGGAVITLSLLTWQLGGVGAWFPTEWAGNWDPVSWVQGGDNGRSIMAAFISAVVWFVATSGSDQMAIQRYLATRDVHSARKMMGVSLITNAGVQLLLAAVGFALLAYFTARPDLLSGNTNIIDNADRLFPSFIVAGLPVGMSGLVIAGLLSAAMSSLSSGLNSACAVISVDLLDRKRSDGTTSADNVALNRWISVGVGVVVLTLSTLVTLVQGNLLELSYKVVNLLACPLFGLFAMAMFVRRATGFATIIGAAAGLFTVTLINYWTELTGDPTPPVGFLWAMPLGLLVQLAVGIAATYLPWGRHWESLDDFRTRRTSQNLPTGAVQDA